MIDEEEAAEDLARGEIARLRQVESNLTRLLATIATEQKTCSCGAALWMVTHANGKRCPYTAEGLNHFIDCPDREQYRRPRDAKREGQGHP